MTCSSCANFDPPKYTGTVIVSPWGFCRLHLYITHPEAPACPRYKEKKE